jgi:hypothetical protein
MYSVKNITGQPMLVNGKLIKPHSKVQVDDKEVGDYEAVSNLLVKKVKTKK